MRSGNHRRATALLAVALSMTGCGVGASAASTRANSPASSLNGSPAALAHVLDAIRHTMILSAAVRLQLDGASSSWGSSVGSVAGSGVVDFATGNSGEILADRAGTEQLVFGPTSVYDQPPQGSGTQGVLPQGKDWLGGEPTDDGGMQLSLQMLQLEGENPGFLMELADWGATSAAQDGPQTVGLTTATEYKLAVDPRLAAARATGPMEAAFAATLGYERSASSAAKVLPGREVVRQALSMQVWVDAAGQVVQVQASLPGSGSGQVTATFTKFGVPVKSFTPPASQTVDLGAGISFSDKGDGDAS